MNVDFKLELRKVSFESSGLCPDPYLFKVELSFIVVLVPSIITTSKLYYNYAREFSRVTYRFVPKAVVL